nr:site-specific integrase [uncultured Holophaga sp.]
MTTVRRFESLSLVRSKRTPYLIASFTVDGQRRRRTTKETRVEPGWAVALEIYRVAKLRARGLEPEPTVRRLVELWVETHALRRSPSHTENMDRFGRLHLGCIADLQLSEVTTKLAEDAQTEYLKNHAQSSAEVWAKYLHRVFSWACDRKMIREIPWRLPRLHPQKKPKQRLASKMVEVWVEEVDALCEAEPAIALVVRLMLGLGLRVSEARSARWEWLDLEAGEYSPGQTKGREARPRPVQPWLLDELKARAQATGYMVPTREGKVVSYGRVKRAIEAACRAANMPRLTPHHLRHTYATWLSEEGAPIQDIQAVLGHADIRTTVGYLGVDLSRVRSAQARVASRVRIPRLKTGAAPSADPMGV